MGLETHGGWLPIQAQSGLGSLAEAETANLGQAYIDCDLMWVGECHWSLSGSEQMYPT